MLCSTGISSYAAGIYRCSSFECCTECANCAFNLAALKRRSMGMFRAWKVELDEMLLCGKRGESKQ
jgi:hypothetical protein